jgi:hypothetical protein
MERCGEVPIALCTKYNGDKQRRNILGHVARIGGRKIQNFGSKT